MAEKEGSGYKLWFSATERDVKWMVVVAMLILPLHDDSLQTSINPIAAILVSVTVDVPTSQDLSPRAGSGSCGFLLE